MSARHMASIWLCTASFRMLFHSDFDICFSNRKKIEGMLYVPRMVLTILNQNFSSGVFIASCLIAISCSKNAHEQVYGVLCITVSRGNTPSNARVMQFGVLSGKPCICLRDFLWNFSRFSMSFFMWDKV